MTNLDDVASDKDEDKENEEDVEDGEDEDEGDKDKGLEGDVGSLDIDDI
jgi:hypothetical protein